MENEILEKIHKDLDKIAQLILQDLTFKQTRDIEILKLRLQSLETDSQKLHTV